MFIQKNNCLNFKFEKFLGTKFFVDGNKKKSTRNSKDKKIFDPKIFLTPKFFLTQKFFDPKICLTRKFLVPKIFFDLSFFDLKIFGFKNFFDPKFILTQKYFWLKNCFEPKIFWPILSKKFWPTFFGLHFQLKNS